MYLKILEKNCVKIYEPHPAYFSSAPGLPWQAYFFKKKEKELGLLTDIDMLLMVAKGIRGGIYIKQYIDMQ